MRMQEKTYKTMNELVAVCFDANAIVDNLAYNLDYHYFNEIGTIVHQNVAHVMPELADEITDEMLLLSARPTRKAIPEHGEEYGTLAEIFAELSSLFVNMSNKVKLLIDVADMNGDAEVRTFAEDFLAKVTVFVKQADEWVDAIKKLTENEMNFHIKQYTHFISL